MIKLVLSLLYIFTGGLICVLIIEYSVFPNSWFFIIEFSLVELIAGIIIGLTGIVASLTLISNKKQALINFWHRNYEIATSQHNNLNGRASDLALHNSERFIEFAVNRNHTIRDIKDVEKIFRLFSLDYLISIEYDHKDDMSPGKAYEYFSKIILTLFNSPKTYFYFIVDLHDVYRKEICKKFWSFRGIDLEKYERCGFLECEQSLFSGYELQGDYCLFFPTDRMYEKRIYGFIEITNFGKKPKRLSSHKSAIGRMLPDIIQQYYQSERFYIHHWNFQLGNSFARFDTIEIDLFYNKDYNCDREGSNKFMSIMK